MTKLIPKPLTPLTLTQDVSKVLLGASAVLSNGTVLSRAGCAVVAGAAAAAARPVIICCETYKFAERVLLDSITLNELGDPAALAAVPLRSDVTALDGWAAQPRLSARPVPSCLTLIFPMGLHGCVRATGVLFAEQAGRSG